MEMGITRNIHVMTTLVADNIIEETGHAPAGSVDGKPGSPVDDLFMSRVERDKEY